MRKGTTLFIAAYNARSISYAQTLKHRQVRISKTLILKPSGQSLPKSLFEHLHSHRIYSNILLPDFSVPLHDTCSEISDRVEEIDCSNINSDVVFDKLKTEIQDAQLVVYSGFGGQIVNSKLLTLGASFLHAHSGWLPNYRGSTTIYYSLLEGNGCGVSVILLSPDIDCGPIVARRRYPIPPNQIDIDYVYDPATRADLLVDVLANWQSSGVLPTTLPQSDLDGDCYFVIHPILKHLSRLSLSS
jgi:methionyl-tRNA formyltransferase